VGNESAGITGFRGEATGAGAGEEPILLIATGEAMVEAERAVSKEPSSFGEIKGGFMMEI
jgi:hypothetical protein